VGNPGLYQLISAATKDFIWDTTKFDGWPDPREYLGVPGLAEFVQAWVEPYEDWRIEVEEIVDAGGERVVALLHQVGRLHGSESEVEMRYGIVYSFREGKISHAAPYATYKQALEAAGLSE
jgi:ketosteroid isomerase-like protein